MSEELSDGAGSSTRAIGEVNMAQLRPRGLLPAGLILCYHLAAAQNKRCDLAGTTEIHSSGVPFVKCLDISALDGKTVSVPENVTRIDNDGLSLCRSTVQGGGTADIVYVMDQSGSMYANYVHISPSGDTTYIERRDRCDNPPGVVGRISIPYANSSRTVDLLDPNGSVAGCPLAGDPFAQRGVAFKAAIAYQAELSPTSTAGYLGFNSSIVEQQSPLVLSPGNVALLQGTIGLKSGGTYYKPPLEKSKQWLTDDNLIKTSNQAVIFLSDGQPYDTYLQVLEEDYANAPGRMPPIYGIFLGNPDAAYQKLEELSTLTGGRFYLIPSDRPDSLKAVVAEILNFILLEFRPVSATITNSSLSPAQTSAGDSAGFVKQSDGSWLMRLDSVVALRKGSNEIVVNTRYRESQGDSVKNQAFRFWLDMSQPPENQDKVLSSGGFSIRCHDPSTLEILNQAGLAPPYFTEADTALQARISTSPSGLQRLMAPAATRRAGDDETLLLDLESALSGREIFRRSMPLAAGRAPGDGNGTLESAYYDSVVVSWEHPRDARDFAADTVPVRAASRAAEVYFAASPGGEKVDAYPISQRTVHIVVKDQVWNPGLAYTVLVKTANYGEDREILALSEISPGVYGAQVPVNADLKQAGDGTLQVALAGDQLTAVHVDPVYGDTAVGNAGYDQNVEVDARLEFTDAQGVPIPPGAIYSPANGKLYLRLVDDRALGLIASKRFDLSVENKKYGLIIGTDEEYVDGVMQNATSGNQGTWSASIDLKDLFPAVDGNGVVETHFRGEVTATATPHDNQGQPLPLPVSDFLVVAFADQPATIEWRPADSTISLPPGQEGLIITVHDQPHTQAPGDSVEISLKCLGSGDSLGGVVLHEGMEGAFVSGPVRKNVGHPDFSDNLLSCLSRDDIEVRYVDPVHGTVSTLLIQEVAAPVATPKGRHFLSRVDVVLSSATPGAQIRYTLDGSVPDANSALYRGPVAIIGSSTLRAIAFKPGWKKSRMLEEVYVKDFTASKLEILDERGNPLADGALTQRDSLFMVKITTTQAGLPGVAPEAATSVTGDVETPNLSYKLELGDRLEYRDLVPLEIIAGGAARNDTVEAFLIDTLIVTWRNPVDPADIASDTVIIRPFFQAAEVYFSSSAGGSRVSRYPSDQDTAYVVVMDQPGHPGKQYRAAVGSESAGDSEDIPLMELSPGLFAGRLPISKAASSRGDGNLQVSPAGDQLQAVFVDPIYGDTAVGNVGFDQDVQESARLEFTDSAGAPLPPSRVWDPSAGKVYLRYFDDWNPAVPAGLASKEVKLSLRNKKGGSLAGEDEETGTVTLVPAKALAARGHWEGSFALGDVFPAIRENGVLEAYFRGELTASILPHNNAGQQQAAPVSDLLIIAYPDRPASISIADADGGEVDRLTERLHIRLKDQLFTRSGPGTINVQASCGGSGDMVQSVELVAVDTLGNYETRQPLEKGEWLSGEANTGDSILECRESDVIAVHYVDPVYATSASEYARYEDNTGTRLYFASAADSAEIKSAHSARADRFLVVVESKSPRRDERDTLEVLLTAPGGESEKIRVVETEAYSGIFHANVPFAFGVGSPAAGNGSIEARIDNTRRINAAEVKGQITVGGEEHTASLTLISEFNLAVLAYAKDEDGNGRVDRVYFVFDRRLSKLPSGLDAVYWNEATVNKARKAPGNRIAYVDGDSTRIVADFREDEFGANLTGPGPGEPPYARFPADKLFGGQTPLIADSVGPVLVSAHKLPSDLTAYDYSETEKRFSPDTLIVVASEELRTRTLWADMLRFSRGCSEFGSSIPVRTYREPEVAGDGVTWTVIVDNAPGSQSPVLGDCIFLSTDGRYTDVHGNLPPVLGVELDGQNPKRSIRLFRAYPPVAGLDPSQPEFVLSVNEKRGEKKGAWSTRLGEDAWIVEWIPPHGYREGETFRPYLPSRPDEPARQDMEYASPVRMPRDISAVQVVTTGKYVAHVTIFDHLGHFVKQSSQSFGYHGELRNPNRSADMGLVSYLIWDMRDSSGRKAGNGAYIWKVLFKMEDGREEVQFTRTGLVRH